MKSIVDFMNMKVDLKEFSNIYNNYATNKVSFGGGTTTVRELLMDARFSNSKKNKKLEKGGSEIIDDNTTTSADYTTTRENFFYYMQPTNNYTNVNDRSDMNMNQFNYPSAQVMERSII